MSTIGTETPCRASDIKELEVEGDLLLYFHNNEAGHILNSSARAIWRLCDGRHSIIDISHKLELSLGLPEGTLLADIRDTVARLRDAKVLSLQRVLLEGRQIKVDWLRMAQPQRDGYDTTKALKFLAARETVENGKLKASTTNTASSKIDDTRISVRHSYPEVPAGFIDAPLNHPNIKRATEYLHCWPRAFQQFQLLISAFHPLADLRESTTPAFPEDCESHSSELKPGRICATISCPLMLAEAFAREISHQKLFALGVFKDASLRLLTNSPDELFVSPRASGRLRPMSAVLHDEYAILYVTQLLIKILELTKSEEEGQRVSSRLSINLTKLEDGLTQIKHNICVDSDGADFLDGLYGWAENIRHRGEELARAYGNWKFCQGITVAQPIKVFVGTAPAMKKSEIALEYSIRSSTKSPVDIIWMDHGREGLWADWNIGRKEGGVRAQPGPGWVTEFSGFRFSIPEANGFSGRAIYLDVDMIVLRDMKELFDSPMSHPVLATPVWPDVLLFDCEFFRNKDWWPCLGKMKSSGRSQRFYMELLRKYAVIGTLSTKWNCRDGKGYILGETGVMHYTELSTQPWEPYPDTFSYTPHKRSDLVELWWQMYNAGARTIETRGRYDSRRAM